MNTRRIAVTGIGVVSANADSAAEYTRALREGRSGVAELQDVAQGFAFRQGGEVHLEDAEPGLDRVSQLVVSAARQAVSDSGLEAGGSWKEGAAVHVGTSRGPALSLERLQRPTEASDRMSALSEVPFFSIARNVAQRLECGGWTSTVTMACVSSSLAIGTAMDAIRRGRAKVALAGGGDALTSFSYSGFSLLRAMTRTVCRPFDRHRDGMVLGEGAGMLVLEDFEHARQRGARIYAELPGWGTAGDAYHATGPHPKGRGLSCAMKRALDQAEINGDQIEHLNLHGTGTRANDPSECHAVHEVFGDAAGRIPLNSLKPMIGHTLGGAGVLELAGSLLGMHRGFIAPTLNHRDPDPACRDLRVVHGAALESRLRVLMSTKSAFGGANVAIVARRV